MKHLASPEFWAAFNELPAEIRDSAKRNFELLKSHPAHPSLHFKKTGKYRSVRIGLRYRALGIEIDHGILWFWIGTHADYDKLLKKR